MSVQVKYRVLNLVIGDYIYVIIELCPSSICDGICSSGGTCSCSAGMVTCNCLPDFTGNNCETGQ